eukprot:3975684-Prymnesium_polylepis.2
MPTCPPCVLKAPRAFIGSHVVAIDSGVSTWSTRPRSSLVDQPTRGEVRGPARASAVRASGTCGRQGCARMNSVHRPGARVVWASRFGARRLAGRTAVVVLDDDAGVVALPRRHHPKVAALVPRHRRAADVVRLADERTDVGLAQVELRKLICGTGDAAVRLVLDERGADGAERQRAHRRHLSVRRRQECGGCIITRCGRGRARTAALWEQSRLLAPDAERLRVGEGGAGGGFALG